MLKYFEPLLFSKRQDLVTYTYEISASLPHTWPISAPFARFGYRALDTVTQGRRVEFVSRFLRHVNVCNLQYWAHQLELMSALTG